MQVQDILTVLTQLCPPFPGMVVGSVLSDGAVVYGYEEAGGDRISVRAQPVLAGEYQKMFRLSKPKEVTQHHGQCSEGEFRDMR